jgi:hypothetical protein
MYKIYQILCNKKWRLITEHMNVLSCPLIFIYVWLADLIYRSIILSFDNVIIIFLSVILHRKRTLISKISPVVIMKNQEWGHICIHIQYLIRCMSDEWIPICGMDALLSLRRCTSQFTNIGTYLIAMFSTNQRTTTQSLQMSDFSDVSPVLSHV